MVRTESSPIVRLSTRDIAPADRLNYANWILSVADGAAPTEVSAGDPCEFELEATALELPAVTIVEMSGSPQRSVRRFETRRTVQRTFGLNLGIQRFMARHAWDALPLGPWRPQLHRFAPPVRLRLSDQLERCLCAAVGTIRAQMGAQSYRAG